MASSRCNLHEGSELKEVIRVVLGDTVVIAGARGGPRLDSSVLLGTDGGHCNNELLQDIKIVQLSKLHRKQMFNKRKWLPNLTCWLEPETPF